MRGPPGCSVRWVYMIESPAGPLPASTDLEASRRPVPPRYRLPALPPVKGQIRTRVLSGEGRSCRARAGGAGSPVYPARRVLLGSGHDREFLQRTISSKAEKVSRYRIWHHQPRCNTLQSSLEMESHTASGAGAHRSSFMMRCPAGGRCNALPQGRSTVLMWLHPTDWWGYPEEGAIFSSAFFPNSFPAAYIHRISACRRERSAADSPSFPWKWSAPRRSAKPRLQGP